MISDYYPLKSNIQREFFLFQSIGEKGSIEKFVMFELLEENRYNLAFGDIVES
jgi:hypothetical protein